MKEILKEGFRPRISYHKKIKQIDDEIKSIVTNEEKINSKNNLLEKNNLKRKEFIKEPVKEISKDALFLLQQKGTYLSKAFEINEKKEEEEKEEVCFKIKKERFTKKGFATSLLLEGKSESNTSEKLALSRKKTRLEQYIHTQYLFNCQVQAFLAMATILSSILEYENTVVSVGKEKVRHTFKPYDYEAKNFNYDKDYYNKQASISNICSYISFILSIFLWISIYFDKVLFFILLKGYREKSYKIIITENKQIFRLLSSIICFFLCPNPFTYGIEINFHNDYYSS